MKIVQVINSLSLGGAEVFVTQLSIALRRKCDVEVWTYGGAQDAAGREMLCLLEGHGVEVRSINVRKRFMKAVVPLLWRQWLRQVQPDIVNAHLDQSELFIALAARPVRSRTTLVRTLHNTRVNVDLVRRLGGWLGREFEYSVACSDTVLGSPDLSLDLERASSIACGIRLPPEMDPSIRSVIRGRLGLASNIRLLLCIGSMDLRAGILQKGQDRIIREFASGCAPGVCSIAFLGDGTERRRLERLAEELGVGSSVHFLGAVGHAEKWDYIHACDCGLIYSVFEGLPLAGMEFTCAGVPLILSNIPELTVFSQGGNVVACDERLSATMERACRELTEWRARAIRSAKSYRQAFSIESCADKYYRLYRELIDTKRFAGGPVERPTAVGHFKI